MSVHVQHAARRAAAVLMSLVALTLPLAADAQTSATLQWRTYAGGQGTDRLTAVAKAPNGDLIVVGVTTSASLEEPAGAGTIASEDYFIARYNSAGVRQWVHVYGGNQTFDRVNAITVTPNNDIYIAGSTRTSALTNVGTVYGGSQGDEEGFVASINYTDGFPLWFMYLYGPNVEVATGVVAANDGIYVTGHTNSSTFCGYVLPPNKGTDAFVIKVNPADPGTFPWGTTLPFKLIGGSQADQGNGIILDGDKILVVGTTRSDPISVVPAPVTGFHGDADAFVARLDTGTGAVEWVTNVGGTLFDDGRAITVQPVTHQIAIAGTTTSSLGGPIPPLMTNAFAAWLNGAGAELRTRVFGGNSEDEAVGVAFDAQGTTYIAGTTGSMDLPVTSSNALDSMIEGGSGLREGYVAAFPVAGGAGWASFFGGNFADNLTSMALYPPQLLLTLQTSSGAGIPTPVMPIGHDPNLSVGPDGYLGVLNLTDITPPTGGKVNDRPAVDAIDLDIDALDLRDVLYANWNGFTHPSPLKYEWAIGTLAAPEAIQTFTSVGAATSAVSGTLLLQVGSTYYVTVRAASQYGITSTKQSDGVMITPRDAGTPDAGMDAGTDGGMDAGMDAGTDGGMDAGMDAGTDAGTDGGTGGTDAGTDGGTDAGTDGGTGGTDAGTDGGISGDGGGTGNDGGTHGDDGGPDEGEPRSPIGCGCSSEGGSGAPLLLGMMLLALLARRSRDSAP